MNTAPLFWNKEDTPPEFHSMLRTLGEEYPISENGKGMKISFKKIASPGKVHSLIADNKVLVEYGSVSDAARGLANALAGREVEEDSSFKTLGIMLDCSRNAVMKVDYLKKWLRRLAMFGYNLLMLYTEDTYQLPDEPYFGYMRGGYSREELKEIDSYAAGLGIEVCACIQTLGHMGQALKWQAYKEIADTGNVMLVDEAKSYELIEKMIKFWSETLNSKRIHFGMDEAHDLGRGKHQNRFGYESQFDIFNRHLSKVCDISRSYGLKPMIWSDMYFRMGNNTHDYYGRDTVIPEDVKQAIPNKIDLVYWDYYHEDADFYSEWIERHRSLDCEPLMASGIWTWCRFWYDHTKTFKTISPCIQACREKKVSELFFTLWGDDGAYCEFDSALAGLAFAADLAYGGKGDDKDVEAVYSAVCGSSYLEQLIPSELQIRFKNTGSEIFTSSIMWDDPLLGIAWNEALAMDSNSWSCVLEKLHKISNKLSECQTSSTENLQYATDLCNFMIQKIKFRKKLVYSYKEMDRLSLKSLTETDLSALLLSLDKLQKSFRKQWLKRNKIFGMEVIQNRFAALKIRHEEAALRIRELLDGNIDDLEELEQKIEAQGDCLYNYRQLISGSSII